LKSKNQQNPSLGHLLNFESSWHQWTLENGVRCLHIPLPEGDRRFHLTALIGCGSRDEPKKLAGISHLLEHMMFRGSEKHPTFSDLSIAFERLGGEWNAATGHEYTEFYFSGTAENYQEVIALFADFMMRPRLDDLETERKIVQRELEGELNENGVSTDPDYHIATKIWKDQPMAMPIVGTPETLAAISQNNIRDWYAKNYTPGNTVICAVGGTRDSVQHEIKTQFSDWIGGAAKRVRLVHKTEFKGPYAFFVENSDNEYQVQLSFLCEGTGSPKTALYELLSRVLSDGFSSRLTQRIREELGLVYDISTGVHQYDGAGLFNISASVLGENLTPFFAEIFAILDKLRVHEIGSDEIERHRKRSRVDLDVTTGEPATLAWRGSWGLLSATEIRLSEWSREYELASAGQLKTTARELFLPENLCLTALGPKEKNIEASLCQAAERWRVSLEK
jgi:predicted Zn-dependent peptidase